MASLLTSVLRSTTAPWRQLARWTVPAQARFNSSSSGEHGKKRFGVMAEIRPECVADYVNHHEAVWPGVLETIRRCNISNYSIYLRENMLFGYFEYSGTAFEADMKKMAGCPETQRWHKLMKPMQKPNPNLKEEDWWTVMDEVFHTD